MSVQTTNLVGTDLDFIGFTYNGVHSSELGIVRTSNGDRYNTQLLPDMKDKTVEVPGRDGVFYFGSEYKQKPFEIPFATDSVTEEQYRKICQVFGDKEVHPLIFDEAPYKAYQAKCTASPQFNFICFEQSFEQDGVERVERIYKGEGTIKFVCYYPFAQSVYEFLDEYRDFQEANITDDEGINGRYYRKVQDIIDDIRNLDDPNSEDSSLLDYNQDGKVDSRDIAYLQKEMLQYNKQYIIPKEPSFLEGKKYYTPSITDKYFQWAASSKLQEKKNITPGSSENFALQNSKEIVFYNPGDLETSFCKIYIDTDQSVEDDNNSPLNDKDFTIFIKDNNNRPFFNRQLTLRFSKNDYAKLKESTHLCIDLSNNLIYGVNNFYYSNNIEPTRTNYIFNNCIVDGDFFKIPCEKERLFIVSSGPEIAKVNCKFLYY